MHRFLKQGQFNFKTYVDKLSTIQDKKRVQLACIFTDTRHPIAIEHVRARARAFPSYNFEIMQKERVRAWWARREDRGTRWYVTDYRAECRVLCQGGCRQRLHLPHESRLAIRDLSPFSNLSIIRFLSMPTVHASFLDFFPSPSKLGGAKKLRPSLSLSKKKIFFFDLLVN